MQDKQFIEKILRFNDLSPASSDAEIAALLKKIGWADDAIAEAIAAIRGGAPAPSSSASAAPSISSDTPQPAYGIRPTFAEAGSVAAAVRPPRLRLKFVIIAAAVFATAGGAAAGLYYFPEYNPFASAPFSEDRLFTGLIAKNRDIMSAEYQLRLSVRPEDREKDRTPFPRKALEDALIPGGSSRGSRPPPELAVLDAIPADFSVVLGFGGAFERGDRETPDTKFQITAEVDSPDFSFNADAEFRKKEDDIYLRLNRFPSLFGNIAAIRGTWIHITAREKERSNEYAEALEEAEGRAEQFWEELGIFADVAEDMELFRIAGEAANRAEDTGPLYRYTLTLDGSKLGDFYRRATREIESKFKTPLIGYDDELHRLLEDERYAEYFEKNQTVVITVERRSGRFHSLEIRTVYVPDSDVKKLQDKQIAITLSFGLSKVNEPVVIERPEESISGERAAELLFGRAISESQQKARDAARISHIAQLQLALELYYDAKRGYPKSLNELTAGKFISSIPLDPKTKAPYYYYPYSPNADGKTCRGHHLGATLEVRTNAALANDADLKQSPGTRCGLQYFVSGTDPIYDIVP